MKEKKTLSFALDNFQGPIELLYQLIQREEIDLHSIALYSLAEQFTIAWEQKHAGMEVAAEFIATTASLIWLKSKALLPRHDESTENENNIADETFALSAIPQLLDYCRFRQAGRSLVDREEQQKAFYARGSTENPAPLKRQLGIDHLSLGDLAQLFQVLAAKNPDLKGPAVHSEPWKVSDKISFLRRMLAASSQIEFAALFHDEMERLELIVIFLAILELMKLGEICVVRHTGSELIVIQILEDSKHE